MLSMYARMGEKWGATARNVLIALTQLTMLHTVCGDDANCIEVGVEGGNYKQFEKFCS